MAQNRSFLMGKTDTEVENLDNLPIKHKSNSFLIHLLIQIIGGVEI